MPIHTSSRAMTFTGCWTCKARKVACDERPIACKNCEKRGMTCGGYDIKLQWVSDPLAGAHSSPRHQGRIALKLDQNSVVHKSETIDLFLADIDRDTPNQSSSQQGPFSVFPVGETSLPETVMTHTTSDSSSVTTIPQHSEVLSYTQFARLMVDYTTYQSSQPSASDIDFNMQFLPPSEPITTSVELLSAFDHSSPSSPIAEVDLDNADYQDTSVIETGITPFRYDHSPIQSIYTRIFKNPEIAFLMNHYDTHVASLLMPIAHSENPFRRLYLSTAIEGIVTHDSSIRTSKGMAYTALSQSLLASAAFHRWNCDQRQITHREAGARYRYRAIRSLQNAVSHTASVANYQVIMMAILSLVTIGVLSGEGEEFRVHIDAAAQLRNSRSRWKLMSRTSQQLNEVSAFLALLSRTMSFKASPLPWSDRDEQAASSEDATIQSGVCYEYVYGIKPGIAVAINRTCRLAEHLIRAREEGEQQMPDAFLEGCEELGDMLESWRLEEERPTSISSDDDLGLLVFTHQAKAWHSAALIYYYTRIQGAQPADLIQEVTAVAEHMYATEDIKSRLGIMKQDNPMAPITWPAFIASCNALRDMRQVWKTWWEGLRRYKIGNIDKQWNVIQRIWEVLDTAKSMGNQSCWTKAYDIVGIHVLPV
ncbi:lysyl oxidase 2 3 4 [Fusarium longipes]|uniref:Lysyl oxidase 2 3 4 n=1 Tax=Fusarium longipes TaxID=694270 RepID=A0A395T404_9HYPO|nr:lysyl oxidase 2 3 4 [Fusarium longipes]